MEAGAPAVVKTTCPYCGVGCGVEIGRRSDGVVTVRGDAEHPANAGRLCSKGAALGETLSLEGRAFSPVINGVKAGWDTALDLVASTFRQTIADHGPDSVAFYVSGQLLTEDYYVANKLMKGFIGSGNIDTNSRLCMASSVAGHRRAFGSDTVPGVYADVEEADLIVLTGSNLAWCHPVLFQRILTAREKRGLRVVVIDPRRTASCEFADMHLAISPDSDVALFLGLLAHLARSNRINNGYVNRHTFGCNEALALAYEMSLEEITERTGIAPNLLKEFYELWGSCERVVTIYSQGVNQSESGADKVNAIINCHLLTGRIGRPGMGPFSVTGQPNAMGGREVGGLANMLAAHMQIDNPQDRERVKRFWNASVIAERQGLKAVDMFRAAGDGQIRAIWIMGTNPVVSMPDADRVAQALASCPFVVVSDVEANTDTTAYAHVLLPAAAWGEKDGTVTNSERRISRQRAFLQLPGEARPDWRIICDVAARMGFADAFNYDGPDAIFREHAALSAFENNGARDFDIGALAKLDRDNYDTLAPVQWPQRSDEDTVDSRFFANGGFYTDDGLGRFVPVACRNPAREGLTLNTGRLRDQWHTMTRTGKAARLMAHAPEPLCSINPSDAKNAGVGNGDLLEINGRGAKAILRAQVTDGQQAGSVFAPMHWTRLFASQGRIGAVIAPDADAISGQPALKQSAVSIRAYRPAWQGFAVAVERPDPVSAYWAIAPVERGFRLELADDKIPGDWIAFAHKLFSLGRQHDLEWINVHDTKSSSFRSAIFSENRLIAALFASATTPAISRDFLIDALTVSHDVASRFKLLAGRKAGQQETGSAMVCACLGVSAHVISKAIANGASTIDEVGAVSQAGTNCGSCRSEIGRMINESCIAQAG